MNGRTVRRAALWGTALLALAMGGCGGTGPGANGPGGPLECGALDTKTPLRAVDPGSASSTIVLARYESGPLKGKTIAFVADEDTRSVITVDVDGRKELAKTPLEGAPTQLLLLDDGRLLVTSRSKNHLVVLHPKEDGSIALGCSVPTGTEPSGVAKSGDSVLVTSGWSHSVDVFTAKDLKRKGSIDVGREPRAVLPSDDGARAFVSHATAGKLTVVDVAGMKVEKVVDILTNPNETPTDDAPARDLAQQVEEAVKNDADKPIPGKNFVRVGSQGFALAKTKRPAGRLLAPQVLVDPGDPDGRPHFYGSDGISHATNNVAVLDMGDLKLANLSASLGPSFMLGMEDERRFAQLEVGTPDCLLPRAAVVDDATTSLLVACFGVDAVVAYDAASAEPASIEKARWNVPAGPTGIALDASKRRLIVFSQFERALEILALDDIGTQTRSTADVKHDRIDLTGTNQQSLPLLLGRQLFYATGDARISMSGVGCASCHPDGREDGLTWATPDGPRRTRPIVGRGGDAGPFGWNGESKDLKAHLTREFTRLNGQGLRKVQLDALIAFMDTLPKLPPPDAQDAALVAKGKAVFVSEAAGCETCHVGGGTDKKNHDVGSRTATDRKASFDTPALFGIGGRAPYFHDGRYKTLDDLLQEGHGNKTSIVADEADRRAVVAYLRSL